MARRFEQAYKIKRGDDLGDPEGWNKRFEDLDLRLHARELDGAKIDGAVDELTAVALQRLNDTFTPIITEALDRLASVGAVFSSFSDSEVEISPGEKTFLLAEDTRASYVETAYVSIRPQGYLDRGIIAGLVDYDRATGLLTVDVAVVVGAGTYSAWDIRVTAAPDLEHATRTDNPHNTTASQVGAYTISETDAAIVAAIIALKGGVGATRDTLKELSDAIDTILGPTPPAALDTVKELAAALLDNPAQISDILTALGNRLRFDTTQSLNEAQRAQALANLRVGGAFASRGLIGANNAATPNSKMDFAADVVVVRNASGATARINGAGPLTNNTDFAGPAANGRDQVGAFSNSSWVHFYWIWDAVTLATTSSAAPPSAGPALPPGYTEWGYICSVYKDSSGNLRHVHLRGEKVSYDASQSALSAGVSTGETSVSVSTLVPPNASEFSVFVRFVASAGSSADGTCTGKIRCVSGYDLLELNAYQVHGLISGFDSAAVALPNTAQNFYYFVSNNGTDGTPSLSVLVLGYTVPNGA